MIDEFFEDIQYRGVAYANRFLCVFNTPPSVQEAISKSQTKNLQLSMQELTLRCDASELPGIQLVTSDNKLMGPIYKMPNQVLFNDITPSFMVSADMAEKYFFDFWMSAIKNDSDTYEYYKNFTSDMMIYVYNLKHEQVYGVKLHSAYPTAINQIALNWQDSEIMRMQVTFAFERYEPIAFNVSRGIQYASGISQEETSLGFIRDFVFGILPSIPNGQKIIGNPITMDLLNGRGLNTSQMIRQGVGMATQRIETRDPVTRTVVNSATSSFFKILGG